MNDILFYSNKLYNNQYIWDKDHITSALSNNTLSKQLALTNQLDDKAIQSFIFAIYLKIFYEPYTSNSH